MFILGVYAIHIYIYVQTEKAKTRDRQIEKIHRLGQASDARDLAAWEACGKKCVYLHARFMRGGWPNNMDIKPDAGWDSEAKHTVQ